MSSLSLARIIPLKTFREVDGALTAIESNKNLPFEIKRVFYIFDAIQDSKRGEHAHIECEQFLIALHGHCDVRCFDGLEYKNFSLNSPEFGLYIPKMIWAEEVYKSNNTIVLVLADQLYQPTDYIRSLADYKTKLNITK